MDSPKASPTLLDVPELPLTTIVSYLGPAATVNFALSHKKIEEFIKTVNLNVDEISLEISEFRCEIRLKFFYSPKQLVWKFVVPREAIHARKMLKNHGAALKLYKCEKPLEVCRQQLKWLTDLCDFPVTNLQIIGPDFDAVQGIFEWTEVQQCENMSFELISGLSTNLSSFKDLETLELIASSWFKPEDMKTLDIEKTTIFSSDWSSADLAKIIQDWKSSNKTKLKTLSINLKKTLEMETILKGLDAKKWDRNRRQRHFIRDDPFVPIDCESAKDIEREDGLLASVLAGDRDLELLVWHDRFPLEGMNDM